MLNVPPSPNPGTSVIEILAIVILISGVMLALLALPSFRESTKNRVKDTLDYLNNRDPEIAKKEENLETEIKERREILDFDLAIFEKK
ncbi:MAG: hypothetical protein ACKOW9_05095 [Candidatus Paceibacterota bacterium]